LLMFLGKEQQTPKLRMPCWYVEVVLC
jgi:hypothetical protein